MRRHDLSKEKKIENWIRSDISVRSWRNICKNVDDRLGMVINDNLRGNFWEDVGFEVYWKLHEKV